MTSAYFTPHTFSFLGDLAANNHREWFLANKSRYEADVKDPALRFINDFSTPLKEISPHFRADPRANGGSLFRIYRDTRFSKDKSPYKTHTGIQFRHEAGRDAHCARFSTCTYPAGAVLRGLRLLASGRPALRLIPELDRRGSGGLEAGRRAARVSADLRAFGRFA